MQITLRNRLTLTSFNPFVVASMFPSIRENVEIPRTIIRSVLVNVMDNFLRSELSSNTLLRHIGVFIDPIRRFAQGDCDISARMFPSSAPILSSRVCASVTAKPATSHLDESRPRPEFMPAHLASLLDVPGLRISVGPFSPFKTPASLESAVMHTAHTLVSKQGFAACLDGASHAKRVSDLIIPFKS